MQGYCDTKTLDQGGQRGGAAKLSRGNTESTPELPVGYAHRLAELHLGEIVRLVHRSGGRSRRRRAACSAALELGRDDPDSPDRGRLCSGLSSRRSRRCDGCDRTRARRCNPNSPAALGLQGWIHVWRGEPELALADVERAIRLSPSDVFLFRMVVC